MLSALERIAESHKEFARYVLELIKEGKLEEAQAALLEYIEG